MRNPRLLMALGVAVVVLLPQAAPSRQKSAPAAPVVVTPVNIELSHLLDEERAERLGPLIERFNSQQKEAHVTLVRRWRVSGRSSLIW